MPLSLEDLAQAEAHLQKNYYLVRRETVKWIITGILLVPTLVGVGTWAAIRQSAVNAVTEAVSSDVSRKAKDEIVSLRTQSQQALTDIQTIKGTAKNSLSFQLSVVKTQGDVAKLMQKVEGIRTQAEEMTRIALEIIETVKYSSGKTQNLTVRDEKTTAQSGNLHKMEDDLKSLK